MAVTENYHLALPAGSDYVDIEVLNENARKVDAALAAKQDSVILTHTKSGTVHKLTGLSGRTGIISAVFKASAAYAEGNTFTVDGTVYAAKLQTGEALPGGIFASGTAVGVILDTAGKTVNFKAGGTGKLEDLLFPVVLDRSALTYYPGYDEVSAAVAAFFQEPEKALLPVLLNTGGEIEGNLLGIESDGIIDFGGTVYGTVHLYRWRLKPDGRAELENLYPTAERTNSAGAAQILKGYQGLTDYGALVVGEHECPASYRLALSSLTAAVSETRYLEMLDAVRAGRAVIIEAGSEILTYVVHDVDIEDAGYDPGHIPFCHYGTENGVLTYTLYAVLSGMAPMKLGSYRELGTLSKPAAAAQIMKGYRAYDDKGRSMTGTLVPNTIQSGSKTITEDDVEEGTYTKFTVTATGSTIDMASAWITNKGDTVPRLRVALIIDGAVVEDEIGNYNGNRVSVSGNKISFSIADDEVLDYSDYTVHWKIVSH